MTPVWIASLEKDLTGAMQLTKNQPKTCGAARNPGKVIVGFLLEGLNFPLQVRSAGEHDSVPVATQQVAASDRGKLPLGAKNWGPRSRSGNFCHPTLVNPQPSLPSAALSALEAALPLASDRIYLDLFSGTNAPSRMRY